MSRVFKCAWEEVLNEMFLERLGGRTSVANGNRLPLLLRTLRHGFPGAWRRACDVLKVPDTLGSGNLLGMRSTAWTMALSWLAEMPLKRLQPSVVCFSSATGACKERWSVAAHLFHAARKGLEVDVVSFGGAIAVSPTWQAGLDLLNQMSAVQLRQNVVCQGAVAARCHWDWALCLSQEPRCPNEVLMDTCILQCMTCGDWAQALKLFVDSEWDEPMRSPTSFLYLLGSLCVKDAEVIHRMCLEAVGRPSLGAEVPKFLWATAMLGASPAKPLIVERLCSEVLRLLPSLSVVEMQRSAWGLAAICSTGPMFWRSIQEELTARVQLQRPSVNFWKTTGEDVTGVLWSCNMANMVSEKCRRAVSKVLQEAGKLRDGTHGLQRSDRTVLLKPSGWGVCDGESDLQLLDLAKERFGHLPIFKDRDHWHGFLHRIDVPCSGLILLAKTYEAFYDLQLQLQTGEILRDYVVLCHGWMQPRRSLRAALWSRGAVTLAGRGRPSCSRTKTWAQWRHSFRAFTLSIVQILTGRQHQIRSHFAHVGHPTVHDSLYETVATLAEDGETSQRNWLHRYRLAFKEANGCRREWRDQLPEDLLRSLRKLRCLRGQWSSRPPAWESCTPLGPKWWS